MARKGTLQKEVETEEVFYSMRPGALQIKPSRYEVFAVADGPNVRELQPGIKINANGAKRETGIVGPFDPSNKKDAEMIKIIDEFIEENPRIVNHVDVQLSKLNDAPRPRPLPNWDSMSAEDIYAAVKNSGLNPRVCMAYELAKSEPRTDVIGAIEKASKQTRADELDTSEKPSLD